MHKKSHKKDDVVGKVAMGAAGVAVTAGVIVAGVALANRKNRQKLSKTIGRGVKTLHLPKYQATTHTVRGRKMGSTKIKRGKKSSKMEAKA